MEKKYELTDEVCSILGAELHRIKALRDFGDVKKGDLGGWVESEINLSHKGDCWVYDSATVMDDALVINDAKVKNNARVYQDSLIADNAIICDNAIIHGSGGIGMNTIVGGVAEVFGTACIIENAKIDGTARIYGNSKIGSYATIHSTDDYITIGPIGSRDGYTTFYKTEDKGIYVCCGYFNESIDKFEKAVLKPYGTRKIGKHYMHAIKFAKMILECN